jgi:predicted RNA-binding Zn ribbon-like protein
MLDWRFRDSGPEELLPPFGEVLRFAEESAVITPKQATKLRRGTPERVAVQALRLLLDLRESVAAICYALVDDAAPPQDAIKRFDQHLRAAQTNRSFHWTNSGLQLAWPTRLEPQLPYWLLAQTASDLLTSEAAHSIRACADPACRWLFLDTSKNHSRRWCDMKTCGNRMKARRFKAQHRA